MTRIFAFTVALVCTAGLSAQTNLRSPIRMANAYQANGNMAAPYNGAPAMAVDRHAALTMAYRVPTMGSYGYAYAPNYQTPYYAPGYGYAQNVGYGLAYTVGGDRAYVTAVEGMTSIPASFAPSVMENSVFSTTSMAFGTGGQTMAVAPAVATTARITAYVPADAEVIIQGKTMTETGPVRTYNLTNLKGMETYTVVVRQNADGKPTDQTMTVNVSPGDHKSVMVMR